MRKTLFYFSESDRAGFDSVIAEGGARIVESDPENLAVIVWGAWPGPSWVRELVGFKWNDIEAEPVFDTDAIERRLVFLGATPREADALTDILHMEGWGGEEFEGDGADIPDSVLLSKIDWYRTGGRAQ